MRPIDEHNINEFIGDFSSSPENFLLLHRDLIGDYKEKIEAACPLYFVVDSNGSRTFFIPDGDSFGLDPIIGCSLPYGTEILIGGIEGKYLIRSLGTYLNKEGRTVERGYEVVDRSTGYVIVKGEKLDYLARHLAVINGHMVTKNCVFKNDYPYTYFPKSGYLLIHQIYPTVPRIYDSEGTLIMSSSQVDKLWQIGATAPSLEPINLAKDVKTYEKMIIDSLCDSVSLTGVESIEEIANYLQLSGKEYIEGIDEVAVELPSLRVYRANYKQYLEERAKCQEQKGKKV